MTSSTSSPPPTFSMRLSGLQRVAAEEERHRSEHVRAGRDEEARDRTTVARRSGGRSGASTETEGVTELISSSSAPPPVPPPCRWERGQGGRWWWRRGGRWGLQLIASRIRARVHNYGARQERRSQQHATAGAEPPSPVQLLPHPHRHRASPGPSPPLTAGPPSSSPLVQLLTSPPVQLLPAADPHQVHHDPTPPCRSSSSPHRWSSSSPSPPPGSSLSQSLSISSHRRSSPQPHVTVTTLVTDVGEEREYSRIHTLLPHPDRCAPACGHCWRHYNAPAAHSLCMRAAMRRVLEMALHIVAWLSWRTGRVVP
jgi:hypothetical protein